MPPVFSVQNHMVLEPCPPELSELTYLEQLLHSMHMLTFAHGKCVSPSWLSLVDKKVTQGM